MNYIYLTIAHTGNNPAVLEYVQGNNGIGIMFTLADFTSTDLASDKLVNFYAKRPSKTVAYETCKVVSGTNRVLLIPSQNMFIEAGTYSCTLEILSTSITSYLGITTTVLTDGATEATIELNGSTHNMSAGEAATYSNDLYTWDGTSWTKSDGTVVADSFPIRALVSANNAYSSNATTSSEYKALVDALGSINATKTKADEAISQVEESLNEKSELFDEKLDNKLADADVTIDNAIAKMTAYAEKLQSTYGWEFKLDDSDHLVAIGTLIDDTAYTI